eukprot:Hpha_TRINITY_DN1412_c0_g1::TRINITY_DN1412_c0_g1_i1::g.9641::m.9641
MCGICLEVRAPAGAEVKLCKELGEVALAERIEFPWLAEPIRRRGPDASGELEVPLGPCVVQMHGSVLSMRGAQICRQPCGSADDGVLLWNGEVFSGLEVDERVGDTHAVRSLLVDAADKGDDAAVAAALCSVEGPFAFAFARGGRLWFGRDPLGRRSLVIARTFQGLVVSSTGSALQHAVPFSEVPTSGVFCLSVSGVEPGVLNVVSHQWPRSPVLCFSDMAARVGAGEEGEMAYLDALETAVRRRCELARPPPPDAGSTGARVGVMFSGGVDCMVIAALAHRAVPVTEPIDLCSAAYGDFPDQTPDRIAARQGVAELRTACPGRTWNLIEVNFSEAQVLDAAPQVSALISPCATVMDVSIGSALWFAAAGRGRLAPEGVSVAAPPSLIRRAGGVPAEQAPAEDDDPFTPLIRALSAEYALPRAGMMLLSDLNKAHPLPWRTSGYAKCAEYARAAQRAGLARVEGEANRVRIAPVGWE